MRREEVEKRPLFTGTDAFPLTLAADFKIINKDRSVEGKKDYPGLLTVPGLDGKPTTLHVKLRTRGHFRLRAGSCSFVPLRVEFDKDETRGTIFDGQKILNGDSGSGKSMFLQSICLCLKKNSHINIAYLSAEECEGGVLEVVQKRLAGPASA